MTSFVLLAIQGILSSVSLFVMKRYLGDARTNIMDGSFVTQAVIGLSVGSLLYIVSFFLWLIILTKTPLSIAYPISIGVTLLATSVISLFLLSETISLTHVLGMSMILMGVVIINASA